MTLNTSFKLLLKYELFFALQLLTQENSFIHKEWKEDTYNLLPSSFKEKVINTGMKDSIWLTIPEVIDYDASKDDFNYIKQELYSIPGDIIKEKILNKIFQSEDIVNKLIQGIVNLKEALELIPKKKREDINYFGVYPYNKDNPCIKALETLIDTPEIFKSDALEIITIFWDKAFKFTWNSIRNKLVISLERTERMYITCDLKEFSRLVTLPVEIDGKNQVIKALKGNLEISFTSINRFIFIPSAFNHKRKSYNYVVEQEKYDVFMPYFEANISLLNDEKTNNSLRISNLDIEAIFKALGDTTRFKIAKIISKTPVSSVQLSKMLNLTKAAISHHIHIMRDAGIINEYYKSGSVILALNKEVIEAISTVSMKTFF